MTRRGVGAALSAAAALAAALHAPAGADPAAARVVDRTVTCQIGVRAGVRKLEVHARSGTRLLEDPRKWKFLASASVHDPSVVGASPAWLAAGWPLAFGPGQTPSRVTLSMALRCKPTGAHVPLTTRGLSGFPASRLEDEYHCVVPRRVIVRVRAVFRAPTTLRRNRRWSTLEAPGVVREGTLAVRSESGAPVALATVHESGKARLYVHDRCDPDLVSSDG